MIDYSVLSEIDEVGKVKLLFGLVTEEFENMDGMCDKRTAEITSQLKAIDNKINGMQISVAQLQIKAGVWGLAGGAIPVLIGALIWYLKKYSV